MRHEQTTPGNTVRVDTSNRSLTIEQTVQQQVSEFAKEHHCPTVSWGVVGDGELILSGAFGSVDENTVYRIASMTKSFSAAATLLMRDEGALRLDTPIADYAPELAQLKGPTDDAPEITVRDLLSMTSGLVTDDAWADRHLDLTDAEFDQIIRDGVVFAEPTGTSYEYSNFGFAVLGRVVRRATGRTIQEIVSERFLEPLGMSSSSWVQPSHDRWARPYEWIDDGFVEELPSPGDGLIAPMGGIWSTVADLARWVSFMDEAYPARDGADAGPLSRASRREMQSAQRYVGNRTLRGKRFPSSYGYGLRVLDEPGYGTVVSHSGGFPGYGSNMRWLPGRGVGVIALANATYAPMTELAARVMDTLADHDAIPAFERPTPNALTQAAQRLIDLLNDWNDTDAEALFTDNVNPDEAYWRRMAEAHATEHLTITSIEAINDARCQVVCSSSQGKTVRVDFALATYSHTQIQLYDIKS